MSTFREWEPAVPFLGRHVERNFQSRSIQLKRQDAASTCSAMKRNYFAGWSDFFPNHRRFLGFGCSVSGIATSFAAGADSFATGAASCGVGAASFCCFGFFSYGAFSSVAWAASTHSINATKAESLLR